MNTKRISDGANALIEHYKNFRIGTAQCSVPYFNNKTKARRGGLRAEVGKGSPKDIYTEVENLALSYRLDINSFTNESLKKFLVDYNIGIDCSGFAYYLLNAESIARGKGSIDKHLHFIRSNIFTQFIAKFRPQTSTDVLTFVHEKNSKIILNRDVKVGDMITMVGGPEGGERNHILIITQIEYQNFIPSVLHYVHAIAWPTDGEYNHGIHEGLIEILDINKSIVEQRWIELEKTGEENYTHSRAKKSTTEIRRLTYFD